MGANTRRAIVPVKERNVAITMEGPALEEHALDCGVGWGGDSVDDQRLHTFA
jgi:hypothetical protein